MATITVESNKKIAFDAKKLKSLTSLETRRFRLKSLSPIIKGKSYVKDAERLALENFLSTFPFVVAFRHYGDASQLKIVDLQEKTNLPINSLFYISNAQLSAYLMTRLSDVTDHALPVDLVKGPFYIAGFLEENAYVKFMRTSLVLEEDVSTNMFALILLKDTRNVYDLSLNTSSSEQIRTAFKTWDSRESVLLELTQTIASVPHELVATLEAELTLGTEMYFPEIASFLDFFKVE